MNDDLELKEAALFEYYNARSAGEEIALAAKFADGTILTGSPITILSDDEKRFMRVSAEEALRDKANMHFGKFIPDTVSVIHVELNSKDPDHPSFVYL